MQAILTVLLLVALLGVSAGVAFAADESGPDHGIAGTQEVVEAEPVDLGTLSGPEKAPSMPYFELRQDNREN